MKHIIVPTDFSDNAQNALDYAVNVANQFDDCTIHLLHVYAIRGETGIMENVNIFMQNKIDKNLTEIIKKIKSSLFNGTSLVAKKVEGYPTDIIIEFAEILKADFVIMGTQGASGLKSVFMGTNTTEVIKKCSRPVLAVPADYKYRPPSNIALAVDSNIVTSSEVVEPLIEIAQIFKSKVHVVHVEKVKELAVVDAGIDIYLSGIDHDFHVVENKDTNIGVNQFIAANDTDFLCMIHRERNFFDRLIYASVTQIEAFNSPVPLLVLHDQ